MVRYFLIVCLVSSLHPLAAFGQSNATDGALAGFIRDATAASVPGATGS